MIRLRSIIAGLAGALFFAAGAHAADMPETWVPPVAVPKYVPLMSGWYVRLDAAYSWNKVGSVESNTPVTHTEYKNTPDFTAGFGYKWQWIRFDLTLDRGSPAGFSATTAAPVLQPQYYSKLGWIAGLGNAYIDMGTWWGFTPYVGAGIGASRLNSAQYVDNGLPPHYGSPQGQRTNFAWAAMAGVSFKVTSNWMIDVGYRYLNLGKVSNTTGTQLPIDNTWIKDVSAQQVRVGVRFLFD